MFSRHLEMQLALGGIVQFLVRPGTDLDEASLERELLPIVYLANPALDSATGLLLPGRHASEVTTRLFMVGPSAEGLHHIGGITCTSQVASHVAKSARARGFHVGGIT
jgi:hypothetical protein